MADFSSFGLPIVIAIFLASALAIGFAGTKLAHVADVLADRTGMGEIVAGALFVGLSTSLPGVITSMLTAYEGYADIAIGNAVGGLTAQTAFLVIADLVYRRGNLEHAAASTPALSQAVLLVVMLTLPLMAYSGPNITVFGISPFTPALFIVYGLGLFLLRRVVDAPMWAPKDTDLNVEDEPEPDADDRSDATMWGLFLLYGGITAAAGYLIGAVSISLVELTPLGGTAVGSVFSAIANSLPELVTAIAAVRIGAVQLAVGDIIGGNAFEVLFLAASDVVYPGGSIYQQMNGSNLFNLAAVILMTSVLLLGMIDRQRRGILGIGWESATVLVLYAGTVAYSFM